MSTTYAGVPSNITAGSAPSITEKQDGDVVNAASDTVAEQYLTDFAAYLDQLIAVSAACVLNNATLGVNPSAQFSVCATGFVVNLGNLWVNVGASGALYTSQGQFGGGWTSRTANVGTAQLNAVASNLSNLLVAVGAPNSGTSAITTSPDGTTWTSQSNPGTTQTYNAVAYSPGLAQWCAVGTSGIVVTSPNGTTWTSRSAGATAFIGITWAAGPALWVAYTAGTTYYTSPDGVTWTSRTLPIAPSCISYGAGVLVLTESATGTIYSSSDGINWTSRTNPFTGVARVNAFNGKMFLCVFNTAYIVTSFDGITWKVRTPINISSTTQAIAGVSAHPTNGTFLLYETGTTAAQITNAWQAP